MDTALYAAAMRGVDVRMLHAGEAGSHAGLARQHCACRSAWWSHGIDVYRYPTGFLHQKVILMDDRIAGVGTVNFDNRSFRINFEITLWFTHERTLIDVEKMLQQGLRRGQARSTSTSAARGRRS